MCLAVCDILNISTPMVESPISRSNFQILCMFDWKNYENYIQQQELRDLRMGSSEN